MVQELSVSDSQVSASPGSAPGVGSRSAVGFLWMLAQTVGARLFSAIGQVFLARLLTPRDFGLVGLANTLFMIALVVVNPGIEDILVSKGRQLHRWVNAAFWMSLCFALIGAFGMVALAPLGAWMYDAPKLPELVAILALNAFLMGILTVPQARLRSQLQFRVLATSGVITAFFHVVMAVSLAWLGVGAVAFVLPLPLMTGIRLVWLWRATRPQLFWHLQLRRWKRLMPDTAALFGGRALGACVSQGDYIILGLFTNTVEVGLYYFAFNLSRQVVQVFTNNMSNVLLPALSTLKAEPERQMKAALRASSMLALFTVPLCAGQAVLAGPLIRLFFGQQWLEAIPVMQWLMVGTAVNSASWMNLNLLQAQGRNKVVLYVQAFAALQFALFIGLGAWFGGAVGVAMASSWSISLSSLVGIYVAIRPAGGGWGDLLKIYALPTLLSAIAIGLPGMLLGMMPWPDSLPSWLQHVVHMAAVVLISIPVYAVGVRVLLPEKWTELLTLVEGPLGRIKRRFA